VRGESITILPADVGSLESYSRSGQVPKNVREILGKAVEFKMALTDTERRLAEKRNALEEIDKEQNRIRSNMSTVNSSSQYYTRLLEKLNAQETDIETIQADVRTLDKKLDEQRQELENYLANLSIE
jgi:chromosome segregation ATPase